MVYSVKQGDKLPNTEEGVQCVMDIVRGSVEQARGGKRPEEQARGVKRPEEVNNADPDAAYSDG